MQPLLAGEPTHVSDYRLLARVGRGSMGGVYLACSRGGRVVAVKLVRPELAEDPQFRERFRREVEMARAVGGFWTATLVDADPEAPQPWLATEFVPGPNLHQAVTEHGPLPEATVRSLAAGLAEALAAIHRAGLVHRDLKPGNVLLGPDGPRVIDFGISRAMTASAMTATGMFFGTPGYFSPEQTLGTEVGPPSDVFSLGAVLVFAATGRGPFGDEHTAAMLYRVVHTEPDLDRVPGSLRPLLAACLAKDPAVRPSPEQLLDRLGEPSPQGHEWLPPAITAQIAEHRTRVQHTSAMADSGGAAQASGTPKPPTRAYTSVLSESGGHEGAAAPPAAAGPPGPAAARSSAATGSSTAKAEPIVPARPRATSPRPVPQQARSRPLIAKDDPGPVFATGGRLPALVSAVFLLALAFAAARWAGGSGVSGSLGGVYSLGLLCLTLSGLLSLGKATLPRLRLKLGGAGLRVSRLGMAREIPWSRVSRVGIVGRGKKQSLAVWFREGTGAPRSTWWHPVRKYHGGARLFPVGATGGWWARRQEVKRLRTGLQRYAPRAYDSRLF